MRLLGGGVEEGGEEDTCLHSLGGPQCELSHSKSEASGSRGGDMRHRGVWKGEEFLYQIACLIGIVREGQGDLLSVRW